MRVVTTGRRGLDALAVRTAATPSPADRAPTMTWPLLRTRASLGQALSSAAATSWSARTPRVGPRPGRPANWPGRGPDTRSRRPIDAAGARSSPPGPGGDGPRGTGPGLGGTARRLVGPRARHTGV